MVYNWFCVYYGDYKKYYNICMCFVLMKCIFIEELKGQKAHDLQLVIYILANLYMYKQLGFKHNRADL